MIGIRVDANEEIGMGHFVRCLAVANQLKSLGEKVMFISSDDYIKEKVEKDGFNFVSLINKYYEKDSEIDILICLLKKNNINTLLLDSYEVTELYMKCLHEIVRIIYIDDINLFKYLADVIINYTYNTEFSIYEEKKYEKNTKFCLGSRYIPLREEFAYNKIEIKKEVGAIFITTGGTDNYNIIMELIKQLSADEFQGITKYIVVGKFYKKYDELKILENDFLKVYQNISDIYNIMKKCDIAISAGGTTVAELCAMGIPTIAFSMADNQLEGTKAYDKDGIIIYTGDVRNDKEKVVLKIIENVRILREEYKLRKKMSLKSNDIIDGYGAKRIAKLISEVETYN